MDFSSSSAMPRKQISVSSMLYGFLSINVLITGMLGLALCFLSLLTDTKDPWLPGVFMLSMAFLAGAYLMQSNRFKKRTVSKF